MRVGSRAAASAVLLAAACLGLAACRGPGRDPGRFVPADADAVLAVRSVAEFQAAAGDLWERLPEAGGLADLLRSAAGLDPRSPSATREQGLDPERGFAVALRGGALLAALPVGDPEVAGRRLGLRLARLGFREVPGAGTGGARRFEDVRKADREAWLKVDGDVALACAGPKGACEGPLSAAPAAEGAGPGAEARAVAVEAGLPGAVASGFVRNGLLVDRAAGALGLALPKGAAGVMVRAAVGDLRAALDLQGGLRVRAVLGPAGDPLEAPGWPALPGPGVLARVEADLASLPAGVDEALRGACGAPCRDASGPGALLAAWDGKAALAVLEVEGASTEAVTGVGALLRRVAAVAALGLRAPGGAEALAAALPGLAGRAGLVLEPVPGQAAAWTGRGPGGLEAAAQASGGTAVVAAGPGAGALARDAAAGTLRGLPGGPLALPGGVLLRLALDPNGAVRALGGTGVDFARHLVTALRVAGVEAALRDGRLVLDGAVALR